MMGFKAPKRLTRITPALFDDRKETPMQRPDKRQQVAHNFTYHPPKPERQPDFQAIRESAFAFATRILALVPDGREQSLALTKLEEVVMWANAGIAREER